MADDLPHETAETQSPPRFGGPEEVMSMTRFLLCEAIYSTGTEFIIDGGAIVDRMELVTRDLPPSLGPGDSYIPHGTPAIKPRPPVERQAHGIEHLDRQVARDVPAIATPCLDCGAEACVAVEALIAVTESVGCSGHAVWRCRLFAACV